MPVDPAPIRGRWTIKARCWCYIDVPGRRVGEDVEVVPVPDEAAIERGAKAHEEHDGAGIGWHPETSTYAVYFPNDEIVPGYDSPENAARDVDRLVALAVLRAALEPTDP